MARATFNVSLDADLAVVLMAMAWVHLRSFNEEVEETLVLELLDRAQKGDLADHDGKLEEIYGQIHNHWEGQSARKPHLRIPG